MSAKGNSSSSKGCCFCNSKEDNEPEYGKIYEHDGILTHYYCLLLSSNMEQKGTDDEGILGFLAEDIQKELRRGKRLVCSYCRKNGATLGCCNIRCKKIFHLPCGLKAGSLHQFYGEFRSYCVNHRPKQKIDGQILKQIGSVDNVLCYICYDKVNTDDFVKTLWAPCCRKDAWFHRNCIQQLALSAGYFFKCPLCNNKKDFQKSMLEYGIYVPSQDASWELVPNAFEELLYRHDQCDAAKCLCPKGRKHTSNNAKWELALCRTCGSQGIHMACGQLKWANPVWECDECTSILRNSEQNKHIRPSNSTAIDSSSKNRDSNSDSEPDSDSDSELDTDTDISVGTETFPMFSLASNSSFLTSPLDSILEIKLRPGPRSFKLQQQMNRLDKCRLLELANTEFNKNTTTEASSKDTNKLSNSDDEKKKPSTSKENNPQVESKKDSCQKIGQLQLSKNNENESQPIQKETDVITIESDDDDVELIELEQKTNLPPLHAQPTQSDTSSVPCATTSKCTFNSRLHTILNDRDTSAKPESEGAAIDLLTYNNIDLSKPTVSELKDSKKNETVILDETGDVATPGESTSDETTLHSNDLEEMDDVDFSEMSLMNIKITNVTSLPPEVFESVPDVICDEVTPHENTDTSSLPTNKMLEQHVTHSSSTKRNLDEANDFNDNCKKIKRNSFDERISEANSAVNVANNSNVIIQVKNSNPKNDTNVNNTNSQQNESIPASKICGNDKDSSKCTSALTTNISALLVKDGKNNLATLVPLRKDDLRVSQTASQLKGNGVSVGVQSNENSVTQNNSNTHGTFTENDRVYLQLLKSDRFYLQPITNPGITTAENADKTNMFTVSSSETILPNTLDNDVIKVVVKQNAEKTDKTDVYTIPLNNVHKSDILKTYFRNKSIMNQANATVAPVPNTIDNQMVIVNEQEATSKGVVSASTSSVGNNSSSESYCDGDAGTRPVETDSSSQKKDDPPNVCPRKHNGNELSCPSTSLNSPAAGVVGKREKVTGSVARSVFPQVTNNHSTCHQPRLIPRYMNLHDLKFNVCDSNNIQMVLYDTFSVNISMKNRKRSKSRLAGVPQEPKGLSTLTSLGASCSSDYSDNTSTEKPRSDKFFRSLKNCSINDKSAYAKCAVHGEDDAKENLDPVRSARISSRCGTSDNVTPTSGGDDTVSVNDRFRDEDNNEMHLVSSDTNLSVLNRAICNMSVDNVTDGATAVPTKCNQVSKVNLDGVQQDKQASVRNVIPVSVEEMPSARLFCKETNRLVHGVDFDLNVVNMNKNVEKVSQDITVPSQRTDGDRIGNRHTDDSPTLRNGYKHLVSTNVMKPKVDNRNVARVSNVTRFNEQSILNKQIDTCDSKKFIRCLAFQENAVRRNDETRTKNNDGFCLKVSIDLCKIQNLIDSKPELFQNRKHDANDQQRTRASRLPDLNDYVRQQRQQIRYYENRNSIGNCPLKNRELQKLNTFLRHQKSNQGIRYFEKDILDR